MAEPGDPHAPPLPLFFKEAVLAFHAGYPAVRTKPLNAREFNRWWYALMRWMDIQSKEGRERIQQTVAMRASGEVDRRLVANATGAAGDLPGSQGTRDPATDDRRLFADKARLLALLADDDPRAIYLRNGGSLDEHGDPLTRGVPKPLPEREYEVTDPTTGQTTIVRETVRPIDPPAPSDAPSHTTVTMAIERHAPDEPHRNPLLGLVPDFPDL